MFTIQTSRDFYEKLLAEFADFQREPASARFAINCAITAYHMHEWIWGDWLKKDSSAKAKLGIADLKAFVAWIERNEPFFSAIQQLTNGSKHFNRKAMQQTNVAGTFDSAIFDKDMFDTTRLEVEVNGAWIPAEVLFNAIVVFWRDFLRDHGPHSDLPEASA
jgi:hypothetical protein